MSAPETLDTPVAVVDLDRLEANLRRWQEFCEGLGLANRPHVKTHKCVEIARRQLDLGAVGLTCQKLGEAEVMIDAGFDDVLIPYNLLGSPKLERLTALLRRAPVAVSVDDDALLAGLDDAASNAERELSVLVECDTGLGRAGVQNPQQAADLAALVARRPSLGFAGFLTYPAPEGTTAFFSSAIELVAKRGLEARVVSAGGTPSMWNAEKLLPVVNEYRAGNYAFYDRMSIAAGAASVDDVALTVAATVVSRPTKERAVLDAGSKSLTSDLSAEDGHGLILEAPNSTIAGLSEEHGHVSVSPEDTLELGQQVRVVPNHACVVSNLFDDFVVISDGREVERWRIAARGRST